MRRFAFALAMVLAACGDPPSPVGPTDELVTPPLFQAAYRVDAEMFPESGGAGLPLVMVRDGDRTRMEITTPESGRVVVISAAGESYLIRELLGLYDVIRIAPGAAPQPPDVAWTAPGVRVRRTGDCRVASETGGMFESTDPVTGQRGVACISSDGVMLEARENGRLVWRASRVLRGPQDPAQFTPPPGAAILDAEGLAANADTALQGLQAR